MCSSKSRLHHPPNVASSTINGRPVLQPKSNQVPCLERRNSLKKNLPKPPTTTTKLPSSLSPPISPKLKSPRPPAPKRGNDLNVLSSSSDKVSTPRNAIKLPTTVKKSKNSVSPAVETSAAVNCSSSSIVEPSGSVAAARREQVAIMQEQRRLKIAHYGRVKSGINNKLDGSKINPIEFPVTNDAVKEERRCSFITPSSDPIYVAYHDQEWGVPVHDDRMLLELLVLTGAQVGSDWSSVLKKRETFREAFSGFDAETVAKFSEKKMISISCEYGVNISQVRGVVDNSNSIVQVKKEFGSLDKYLWGFVNNKPIKTQYRSSNKIPAKTSKSETISKDLVKRGFRYVGPTVIHSFMQAAGLTNDHLITCLRHHQCQ